MTVEPRASPTVPPGDQSMNLDVTTLVCLVSNLGHGGTDFVFREAELNAQAAAERERSALPSLISFMKGKRLLVCETAARQFRSILAQVGGSREKARAEELMKTVVDVPDSPSLKYAQLRLTAKIKDSAKVVFCTGDELGAITSTANNSFVRSASEQGVHFDVFLHEPRALTELKELSASPLVKEQHSHNVPPS